MFSLAQFDSEISRLNALGASGDDRLLAQALRAPYPAPGLTRAGSATGSLFGGLVLAALTLSPLNSDARSIEDMTFNGMNLEEFADYMEMAPQDPLLRALFEDLCMT